MLRYYIYLNEYPGGPVELSWRVKTNDNIDNTVAATIPTNNNNLNNVFPILSLTTILVGLLFDNIWNKVIVNFLEKKGHLSN